MARDHASRGLRDEASVGPDPRQARDLKRLSDLKYRVADGEPDIVGWTVFASTGREVGRVTDLLVDVETREVVMLDVDLRRGDQHTLAPVRAAWIDHAAKRVVLDARELEAHQSDELLPGLPRSGKLSDDDVNRFNDGYVRAYGDRGVDRDADWRVGRGEEELRFGGAPRSDLTTPVHPSQPIQPSAPVRRETHDPRVERVSDGRDVRRPDVPDTVAGSAALNSATAGRDPYFDESRRIDAIMSEDTDRRTSRVDDARALPSEGAIDPRELDGRVRIDEGGTVDERAPVGGVRYEGGTHVPHDYGRPDERYGPEYGTGRIGVDRVVTRHPRVGEDPSDRPVTSRDASSDVVGGNVTGNVTGNVAGSAAPRMRASDLGDDTPDDPRVVRYRRYDDPARPDRQP
jgi:sporulation protein YlmC with PRC-barrel domain